MKTPHPLLVASFLALLGAGSAAQQGAKTLEQEAKRQVGQVTTLCGVVVSYGCDRSEGMTLLNLETPGSKAGVSVAIRQEDRARFGVLFEQRSVFREVCATGPVEKRKKRYHVRVEEPDRLTVREGSAPAMPYRSGSYSSCDVGVGLPQLLTEVRPQYTWQAQDARIQGVVLLEGLVLPTGQVGEVRVLQSLDPTLGLDAEAIKALKAWRFVAGSLAGRPVPVVVTVELSFKLK